MRIVFAILFFISVVSCKKDSTEIAFNPIGSWSKGGSKVFTLYPNGDFNNNLYKWSIYPKGNNKHTIEITNLSKTEYQSMPIQVLTPDKFINTQFNDTLERIK